MLRPIGRANCCAIRHPRAVPHPAGTLSRPAATRGPPSAARVAITSTGACAGASTGGRESRQAQTAGRVRTLSHPAPPRTVRAWRVWRCGGGWVGVCGSHSPPLDADRDWQTGEHLSPWRGIWCGIQLNTMSAHGIPWRYPSVGDKPTARARAAQDLLRTLTSRGFGYAPAARDRVQDRQGRTRNQAVAVDVQGLTTHAVPVSAAIEPPVSKSPGPVARGRDQMPRNPRQPGDSHKSRQFEHGYSRSGAATPSSRRPVPSAVWAAAASHSLAAAQAPSRGADRPPNGSAGQFSPQSSQAPPRDSR